MRSSRRNPSPVNGARYAIARADSRDFIRTVPTDSIDLILTDPPYNLSGYSTGNMRFKWRKEINNDLAAWDRVDFSPHEWAAEFQRVLKPSGNIFAFTSYNLLGKWHEAFDPIFDTFQFMVWHKTNPIPKFRKAGFLNSCELIVCMWNKGHQWNFGRQNEMHNFIETPICMGRERVRGEAAHPTQKPLRVLDHIIKIASAPGAVVFDPFMGVGSTGVAAMRSGRHFVGVEIDPKYHRAARARLGRQAKEDPLAELLTSEEIFSLDSAPHDAVLEPILQAA